MTLRHKRHPDFITYDRINIKTAERWKESHLSGDEWRFSIVVEFYFKGVLITDRQYGNMESALASVAWNYMEAGSPVPDEWLKIERAHCDQPGCAREATHFFALRKEYSRSGEFLAKTADSYRKFCEKHLTRGDCSLEDSDRNYVRVDPGLCK